MKRREFITLLGGAAALPATLPATLTVTWPVVADAQQPQSLEAEMQRTIERKDTAGVVVMAADRKGVIYQGAFGVADIGATTPLKMDSMFRIASMTKAVTSTAAMQLIEQGRLGLEDPVEKYFPQFANL